jgi:hypothetical protein
LRWTETGGFPKLDVGSVPEVAVYTAPRAKGEWSVAFDWGGGGPLADAAAT